MAGGFTPSANPNKRLYNGGSEWQDDIDGLADYYSTFFREYDAVIGRFNGVDPQSEADISISTYIYSGNNPVNYNDPLGNRKASDFGSAGELFDYIRVMGVNSVDFGFENNAYYMNQWGEGGGFSATEGGYIDHDKIQAETYQILVKGEFSEESRKDAYRYIIKSYKLDEGYEGKYWVFIRNDENSITQETDQQDRKAGIFFKTSFSDYLLDMLDPNRKAEYAKMHPESKLLDFNFGDIVRHVYHEITIHGGDIISGFANAKGMNSAEREFRGYYNMYENNKELPQGNMKFYFWSRTLNAATIASKITAAPQGWTLKEYQSFFRRKLGSYGDINKTRQNIYTRQYNEIVKYVMSRMFL